jgi:hypothetical protein
LDYLYDEHKYKFQGIEYSTIKYFDCDNDDIDTIINVGHHLNEDDYRLDEFGDVIDAVTGDVINAVPGIYIFCKCKFLTQENKIIFLVFLFDDVAYMSCNNEPYEYDSSVHIFQCEEYDGLSRINLNTYFWSNLITCDGPYSPEIIHSKNNEKFEIITGFSSKFLFFLSDT